MNKDNPVHLSVVIPIYNEIENIEILTKEVQQSCAAVDNLEIVMVDDCSTDNSWELLTSLSRQMPCLRPIQHCHNKGQSAAVVTGVKAAKHNIIATLDGDGQNDPKNIPEMVSTLIKNVDSPVLIAGHRTNRQDSKMKLFSSKVANRVRSSLLQDHCLDTGCGIKVFKQSDFLKLPHFKNIHRFLPAMFASIGVKTINMPVHHRARTKGVSKYGLNNRLWTGIVDMLGVMWLKKRNISVDTIEVDR